MVLRGDRVGTQEMVLLMFVQIKPGKRWMLQSNVRDAINLIMSAKEKLGELTHKEYLEWYRKHKPECPMDHESSVKVKILASILICLQEKVFLFFRQF